MNSIHRNIATVTPINNEPTTSIDPSRERLAQKIAKSSFDSSKNPAPNWDTSRVATPGELCGFKVQNEVKFFGYTSDSRVQLFQVGQKSQGLILENENVMAASVISENLTKPEGRRLSYDKNDVKAGDFDVYYNRPGDSGRAYSYYDAGHLIDQKFSALDSHKQEKNYIPVHYFYNEFLKEYLVKPTRCDGYVEIPLYSPNPPKIRINTGNYHRIPVGIIFVQLKKNETTGKNKIQDVYYFPNNDFNYERLRDSLGIRKGDKKMSEKIVPYFRLKKIFHQLLRSAIIFDLNLLSKDKKAKQFKQEEKIFNQLEISLGLLFDECFYEENVDPCLYLDCKATEFNKHMQGQPLTLAFSALGEFLIQYAIRNAVKSEVLSLKARFDFLNSMIGYVEKYTAGPVKENTLNFVESFAERFSLTLNELDRMTHTLDLQELVLLLKIYQRLSNQNIHPFAMLNYEIYGLTDFELYFKKFIRTLEIARAKYQIESLEKSAREKFLNFFQHAEKTLQYLLTISFERDHVEEIAFLKEEKIVTVNN